MDRRGSARLAGTSPTLRGMTSELEGPQPTWGNNLGKVPHLSEGLQLAADLLLNQ